MCFKASTNQTSNTIMLQKLYMFHSQIKQMAKLGVETRKKKYHKITLFREKLERKMPQKPKHSIQRAAD